MNLTARYVSTSSAGNEQHAHPSDTHLSRPAMPNLQSWVNIMRQGSGAVFTVLGLGAALPVVLPAPALLTWLGAGGDHVALPRSYPKGSGLDTTNWIYRRLTSLPCPIRSHAREKNVGIYA